MKAYLNRWFIEALSYMTLGLFGSLIIGLLLNTIGKQTVWPQVDLSFLAQIGDVAMSMTGGAIGAAIAYGLKSKPLVIFSCVIVGTLGYDTFGGGPVGAYIATLVVVEISRFYASKTKIDIIITPLLTLIIGGAVAKFLGSALNEFMTSLGKVINIATGQQPLVMGIIVAVIFGLTLTAPISSAALALMLDLSGLAAGAATIGCSAQMVGFAVNGFKDNRWSGLISVGIGTSMLQVPNIIKNPMILLPPTLASAIVAPLMTLWFPMTNNAAGAGMGTSGLIGQIMTIHTMGSSLNTWVLILAFHIVLPIIVSYTIYSICVRRNWIKDGDHRLQTVE
ncbi:PTS sugar transporter subunit IIC [Staphylococcus arlettae]|uniref:PTS transporter subunit IIC n=1 Tax=Staphylococcus TaxID=1279 RepID=UPI000D1A01D7|nr:MULTISPECIES: PTS sugar transporter subunit IIC [Staphylococcus]KAB2478193.1 PTS sugar transporter subunit IIC [Staphylococcus sp. CH99b_3]MBF0737103.1 PTS sugar transporter subunit IIC [Staphylococcus arlettae]MCD8816252.1 PTS sugar transporter subunit IIC [Staphylococcus arlettae]MCD8833789.1 PTS sugar transporter subunit IIC [Staphylococcus arlettae]MCD8838728.1 PTS sugar transporter subunit IIC [Staphylococcus arlettae]